MELEPRDGGRETEASESRVSDPTLLCERVLATPIVDNSSWSALSSESSPRWKLFVLDRCDLSLEYALLRLAGRGLAPGMSKLGAAYATQP